MLEGVPSMYFTVDSLWYLSVCLERNDLFVDLSGGG